MSTVETNFTHCSYIAVINVRAFLYKNLKQQKIR
jgi:hypothetical protein